MSKRVEYLKALNRNRVEKHRLLKKQKLYENDNKNVSDDNFNFGYNNCILNNVINSEFIDSESTDYDQELDSISYETVKLRMKVRRMMSTIV